MAAEYGSIRPTILIGSDTLGEGQSRAVGQILASELFFALGEPGLTDDDKKAYGITDDEHKKLPEAIALYNGGVKFAMENNPSVPALLKLEEMGVLVLIDSLSWEAYAADAYPAVGEVVDPYIIHSLLMYKNRVITL